ncbi:AAA family ATPase [Polaromonas sp.]|uniref:AAA family ATPase n=1 Tax=Polaromonas sp. TaxID=1869339 RepID=UPI0017FF3079|nr:AAA family ATPase [Polaromonas sp.]NMM07783.1 AAA family ATPase [Polaromonas sp.]
MKLEHIEVENYKGLVHACSKLDDFSCVIGENNSGKSTLLQSVLLLINGTKLSPHEYFDSKKEILITGIFSGLTDNILDKIGEENKKKIEKYVTDTSITLARRYATDGTSKLRIVTSIPNEKKFREEKIEEAFKGKKGKELGDTLQAFYPEVASVEVTNALTTQKAAKELIDKYVSELPPDKLILADIALPTGIDNSIRGILPEPVYIPAVKDFSDDLKTKESASFGKLLHILLEVIETDLSDAVETFEALRKKLNRITGADGQVSDERMERVKAIEATIQKNLQETFRDVSIEINIPPPEVKSILSNATIVADDGMRGPVENKGDGFKRAITFSILRTYVQLSQQADWKKPDDKPKTTKDKFLFLFEEPELYLHPQAQNILFEALSLISKTQQVLVTTHSPLFFSPTITKTFIKIYKQRLPEQVKPQSICLTIDLNDMPTKDQFQIISFETGSHAFFSRRVILVEGDSELIALPHIAKMINAQWDLKANSISLVKINGKGSFKRYRDFFSKFNVNIMLVSDLDVLLDGFDKTDPSDEMKAMRSDLLVAVDKIIADENLLAIPNPKLLKEEFQRERVKVLHRALVEARTAADVAEQCRILDEIFLFQKTLPRLEVLSDNSRADIVFQKRGLLAALRTRGIFVLEKGAIEEYYPDTVTGGDKPSMAQSFCKLVKSRDEVLALCQVLDLAGVQTPELEVIMGQIFTP